MNRAIAAAVFVLAAGCNQPAATPVAPVEVPAPPNAWTVHKEVDQITDKASAVVYQVNAEAEATLRVECGNGLYTVDVRGDRLSPSFIGAEQRYYVSYRFDQRPGVQTEDWNGFREYASPPDSKVFLQRMLASKSVFIRVGSGAMDSVEGKFDLTGLHEALGDAGAPCGPLPPAGSWTE
jgi:hypothetical protein